MSAMGRNAPCPPKFSHAATFAARTAIRDRWLTNEPSTPWTTKAAVEEPLHEIASCEVLDPDEIRALQDFYDARISGVIE